MTLDPILPPVSNNIQPANASRRQLPLFAGFSETCVVNDSGPAAKGSQCYFPFIYDGVEYHACKTRHERERKEREREKREESVGALARRRPHR